MKLLICDACGRDNRDGSTKVVEKYTLLSEDADLCVLCLADIASLKGDLAMAVFRWKRRQAKARETPDGTLKP